MIVERDYCCDFGDCFFTGQTAAQLVAAALVLQTLLSIEYSTALILATTIVVMYTATGGFLAITYTDWVQFTIIFIVYFL